MGDLANAKQTLTGTSTVAPENFPDPKYAPISYPTPPFLKWAGGKRWLMTLLPSALHAPHSRYIEPFLGGGAAFFAKPEVPSLLSDLNERLIETYEVVRDDPRALVDKLKHHHRNHSPEYYYRIRTQRTRTSTTRAAQFIYLNRTCWNGLYRLNLNGEFNVPIGTKTSVLDEGEDFSDVSYKLRNAVLSTCDFERSIDAAVAGDLLFVDPPYTVKHNHNGFIKYNEKMFSWADQVRLRDALVRADQRGARILATNAAHECISDLYKLKFRLTAVERSSVISGKLEGRGRYSELLISNLSE
jgi:DNA adenine methylase